MVGLAGIGPINSLTGNADHSEQRPLSPAQQPQKMLATAIVVSGQQN